MPHESTPIRPQPEGQEGAVGRGGGGWAGCEARSPSLCGRGGSSSWASEQKKSARLS
ncbi:MAG: hypothetical protein FWF88_00005 [Peptococcaceae bacterium]|nr:hypothetical protein [Peptococcaceae bacterium]